MLIGQQLLNVLHMNEDEFFDAQFPNKAPLLRTLRTQDTEFDRICLDYQEIFVALSHSPPPGATRQLRYLADLAETLSDLRSSIETRISEHQTTPINVPNPED